MAQPNALPFWRCCLSVYILQQGCVNSF